MASLKKYIPSLKIRNNTYENFEVAGTKERIQGKQKGDVFYFASVVSKPEDVHFYFFQIYNHTGKFGLSDELKRFLKGKSCFQIKNLSSEMEAELKKIIAREFIYTSKTSLYDHYIYRKQLTLFGTIISSVILLSLRFEIIRSL
ncbi:MAG: hypothetical protein RLP14_06025 [Owenweeksia sp.]